MKKITYSVEIKFFKYILWASLSLFFNKYIFNPLQDKW